MTESSRRNSSATEASPPSHVGADRSHISPLPLPLLRRFPALARLPRAVLGTFPTPVQRVSIEGLAGQLWVKRDDLSAPSFGGNKVRALEFLLGAVEPGETIFTIGGEGSTHVLNAAAHARALGARLVALRWRHEMSPEAAAVATRAVELCYKVVTHRWPVVTLAVMVAKRATLRARWIPLGGTSPLGILGHVSAGLELAEQVAAGELPAPARVVVPLGTGGTAAGIALGFELGGLESTVVAARVGPRIASNATRVRALARATAALMGRLSGERVPTLARHRVEVAHWVYGGAYGRPLPAAAQGSAQIRQACNVTLDGTYSAKAFAAALAHARAGHGPTLFWLTFDGRCMKARNER